MPATAGTAPKSSENGTPESTREKRSRPRPSVPSGLPAANIGRSARRGRTDEGLYSVRESRASHARTNSRITPIATSDGACRRSCMNRGGRSNVGGASRLSSSTGSAAAGRGLMNYSLLRRRPDSRIGDQVERGGGETRDDVHESHDDDARL